MQISQCKKIKVSYYGFVILIILLCSFLPVKARAAGEDRIFKAEVVEIIEEKEKTAANGDAIIQQHLKLKGLEGEYRDREFEFNGIGDIDVIKKQSYRPGDKVLAAVSFDDKNRVQFYIVDYVRNNMLWLLAALFLACTIAVGSLKGVRSLLALVITFAIILQFIIPRILNGSSPLLTTLFGSLFILIAIIYITEGFKAKSHIAIGSIFISLFITVIISQVFVNLAKLSGAASEEILFLFNIEGAVINLKGLLLAGIIIGALGVLDDVVISQVAATEEIASADKNLGFKAVFKKAYRVGVSHIASMTNTLFLAYAGISLPLLILFVSGESAFSGWQQTLNTELVATEIVRTLSGSIGLILSVPIATVLAAWHFAKK